MQPRLLPGQRDIGRAPGRAGEDGCTQCALHRPAQPLALQQDPPHGLQGHRPQRRGGRDGGEPAGRQRRELLRRVAEQHCRHEEQCGQVQRPADYWA